MTYADEVTPEMAQWAKDNGYIECTDPDPETHDGDECCGWVNLVDEPVDIVDLYHEHLRITREVCIHIEDVLVTMIDTVDEVDDVDHLIATSAWLIRMSMATNDNHYIIEASSLVPGDLVDLRIDPFRCCYDPECQEFIKDNSSYRVVKSINDETDEGWPHMSEGDTLVVFDDGSAFGFPSAHVVRVRDASL